VLKAKYAGEFSNKSRSFPGSVIWFDSH